MNITSLLLVLVSCQLFLAVFGFIQVPSTTTTTNFRTPIKDKNKPTSNTILLSESPKLAKESSSSSSSSSLSEEEEESIISTTTTSIDPLITNILKDESVSTVEIGGIIRASHGLKIWRNALTKGRLPTRIDFGDDQPNKVWPEDPLYTKLSDTMIEMELPRFAYRHPEIITSILISLIRLIIKFSNEMKLHKESLEDVDDEDEEDDDEDDYFFWEQYDDDDDKQLLSIMEDDDYDDKDAITITTIDEVDDVIIDLSQDEINAIAETVARSFSDEWNGVVTGTTLLDQIFGPGHDILELNNSNQDGVATAGFGLEDGIWKHTGWKDIPNLRNQISSMPELRDLLDEIGRRPTSINSDKIHKFAPRKPLEDGSLGAQFDPQLRESVDGITLSGNLSEMLPSEAVLLRSSSPSLRRLFLAKKVESKLLSYQVSGWTDIPSIPFTTRPLYKKRMPSAPGGPIIVCLDTSWSMSGQREVLSKSVVLACVSLAHKQKRDCQVVAFSTSQGVMESGIISADVDGIQRLLEFLGHSFGGGTDVTGALKFAMTSIDSDVMDASDILMITDGEIPDPPVSKDVMDKLDELKIQKGVAVHGLLVGKRESKPLERISTKIHDFLSDYDSIPLSPSPLPTMNRPGGTSTYTALRAHQNRDRHNNNSNSKSIYHFPPGFQRSVPWGGSRRLSQKRQSTLALRAKKRKKGYDNDDDDGYSQIAVETTSTNTFVDEVEESLSHLREIVQEKIDSNAWQTGYLEKERKSDQSCWKYKGELIAAIDRVGEGLVEREEEARLVVLAILANEHVLLLGVPGTGKSVLGRRLSKLCGGTFFQRLLTRFTTPEELFGPLSLQSLENDEYRRCTTGFLPTASVAFLDEIFKANSAILNTLLTILNERKFDNAGGQEPCPIRCVVGASNELPESDELVALFDRFLLRKEVFPVSDEGVLKMLALPNPGFSPCDSGDGTEESCDVVFTESLDEIVHALSHAADDVECCLEVAELLRDLRIYMRSELQAEITDRRLVKAARLLKICAATDGRRRVDPVDCLLLQHCMWQLPEQKGPLRDWLWEKITPGRDPLHFRLLLDGLRGEAMTLIRRTSGDISGDFGARKDDIVAIDSLRGEVSQLAGLLKRRRDDLLRHQTLVGRLDDMLWIHADEVQSVQQFLSPRADQVISEITSALADASALEMSLSDFPGSPDDTHRLAVVEALWDEGYTPEISFTQDELDMGMKEAKSKYDLETFRKWKQARKRAQKKT